MANIKNKRRQRGSIRPNGAGFQVRVYTGRDPLMKKDLYLHEQAETEVEAEKSFTAQDPLPAGLSLPLAWWLTPTVASPLSA